MPPFLAGAAAHPDPSGPQRPVLDVDLPHADHSPVLEMETAR